MKEVQEIFNDLSITIHTPDDEDWVDVYIESKSADELNFSEDIQKHMNIMVKMFADKFIKDVKGTIDAGADHEAKKKELA